MTSRLKGGLRDCDLHEEFNARLKQIKSQMLISMESTNQGISPRRLGS